MDKINSDHEAGTDTNMTKFEIAQSLMDCLQEIMSIVAVCRYEEPDLLPERVDDAIGDAECALDDIAVILGDARSLLQEVCDDGRAQ